MKNYSSYRAHKVKLLMSKAKNSNRLAILIILAIIEPVRELLISNRHNKFEQDTLKNNLSSYRAYKV